MEEDVLILLGVAFNLNLPLLTAWLLDHWLGDPAWLELARALEAQGREREAQEIRIRAAGV